MHAPPETTPRIRPATPDDLPFLREMLYEAACWRPGGVRPPREEVLSDPAIAHYLGGWGRAGDLALVARGSGGEPLGAAWYRLMPPEDPGYGFVDGATPEVSMAVARGARGRGVGGALLRALLDAAREEGFGALSLSVEEDNPALRLYERCGFQKLRLDGNAWTMRADLTAAVPPGIRVLDGRLSVCRLDVGTEAPPVPDGATFFSVTRTAEELSVVCAEGEEPPGARREGGWRALRLEGPFELSLVGVLAPVLDVLAEAGVAVFPLATFDTDYVLVGEEDLDRAVAALRSAGYGVS